MEEEYREAESKKLFLIIEEFGIVSDPYFTKASAQKELEILKRKYPSNLTLRIVEYEEVK